MHDQRENQCSKRNFLFLMRSLKFICFSVVLLNSELFRRKWFIPFDGRLFERYTIYKNFLAFF